MVNPMSVDHAAIGADTSIGDMVGVGQVVMGRSGSASAPYLDGLESPADGKNIVRGKARGHSDKNIQKIVGGNVLAFSKRFVPLYRLSRTDPGAGDTSGTEVCRKMGISEQTFSNTCRIPSRLA